MLLEKEAVLQTITNNLNNHCVEQGSDTWNFAEDLIRILQSVKEDESETAKSGRNDLLVTKSEQQSGLANGAVADRCVDCKYYIYEQLGDAYMMDNYDCELHNFIDFDGFRELEFCCHKFEPR